MNGTGRYKLSHLIWIVALLPTITIAATLAAMQIGLQQLNQLGQKQQERRVAVQQLAHILPSRVMDVVGELVDHQRYKLEDAEKKRELWAAAFTQMEQASESPKTHDMLRQLAPEFGAYDGALRELSWIDTVGGVAELAPDYRPDLTAMAGERIAYKPRVAEALIWAMESELTEDGKKLQRMREHLRLVLAVGFASTLLTSALAVVLFSWQVNRRLAILGENAGRLVDGRELMSALDGNDEIATLDRNFHDMSKALADARHEERAAVSNSADVICVLDESYHVLQINPACGVVLGVPAEKLVGVAATAILAAPGVEPAQRELQEMHHTADPRHFETQLKLADGAVLDALWTGFYSPEDRSTFCIIHDISRRKRVERLVAEGEAKERLLMERVPAGLLTFDAEGAVLGANRRAGEILRMPGDLMEVPLGQCFGSDAEPRTFVADLLNKATNRVCTMTVERGGEQRVLQVSVRLVQGSSEQEFLAVILDQTDRQQFKQMRERLLSMIAHDIATPLTNIGVTFSLFQAGVHGELSESGLSKVRTAEVESERLVRLFRDLLRAEKHGDVQLEIGADHVDLLELVQQAVSGVFEQAERQQVSIRIAGDSCPARVDSDRMVQVFVNLLTNALKFAKSGDVVSISLAASTDAARVEIADQGPGIPADMLETIFEAFKQVSAEDSTVRGGSGLGLAICRQIVVNHGGSIRAANGADGGAVFTVELPV